MALESIRRMLAEREALAARQAPIKTELPNDAKELLAMIDRAAPHIDEGCPANKWKPSELLKIAYFILATGPGKNGPSDGAQVVWKALDRARRLFLAGRHPNPFATHGEAAR